MNQLQKNPMWINGLQWSIFLLFVSLFFGGRSTKYAGFPVMIWGMLLAIILLLGSLVLGVKTVLARRRAEQVETRQRALQAAVHDLRE